MNRYFTRFLLLSAAIGVFIFQGPDSVTLKKLLLFAVVLLVNGLSSLWLYHLDHKHRSEQNVYETENSDN